MNCCATSQRAQFHQAWKLVGWWKSHAAMKKKVSTTDSSAHVSAPTDPAM